MSERPLFFLSQGVLDLLANRCLAQGTNAWTDVDHTCYTVTTAGSEGFLNILPIYLDHILYPTLTVSYRINRCSSFFALKLNWSFVVPFIKRLK